MVVIRKAVSSDLHNVVILTCEFFKEIASFSGRRDFTPNQQKIKDMLSDFLGMLDYAVFIAESPKKHPLGFCTVFQMPVQIREEPYAILDKLYVRQDYRRRQIGHQLIENAKRFTRSCKGKRLQITMPAFFVMKDALAFFKAERFYETGGRRLKIVV